MAKKTIKDYQNWNYANLFSVSCQCTDQACCKKCFDIKTDDFVATQGILSVIPLQLLSYHVAVLKWVNCCHHLFLTNHCPPGDAMLIVHATSPSLSQWNESRTNCISTHFCELSELSNLLHPFLEHGWPHTWTTKVSRNYGTLHIAGQPDSGTRPALRTLLTK